MYRFCFVLFFIYVLIQNLLQFSSKCNRPFFEGLFFLQNSQEFGRKLPCSDTDIWFTYLWILGLNGSFTSPMVSLYCENNPALYKIFQFLETSSWASPVSVKHWGLLCPHVCGSFNSCPLNHDPIKFTKTISIFSK